MFYGLIFISIIHKLRRNKMIEILGSGVIGGAFGGIASLGKVIADAVDKQRERKHEEKMMPFRQKELEIEQQREQFVAQNALEVAELDQLASMADLDVEERKSAREHDACKYLSALPDNSSPAVTFLMAIVDFCRGITRPLVTWMLVIFVSLQYAGVINVPADPMVIAVVNELTGACITFWFGGKITLRK